MDPITAGLVVGGVSAVTSAAGAISQNRAVGRSQKSAQKAAQVQQRQVSAAAELERQKRRNETARILGRMRVAAAESGLDFTGSYESLSRQAEFDRELNQAIIDQNQFNQTLAIQSGLDANLAQIASHGQNILLSAVSGGANGFNTGLQIGSAFPAPAEPTIDELRQIATSEGNLPVIRP